MDISSWPDRYPAAITRRAGGGRIVSILFVALLSLVLAACGRGEDDGGHAESRHGDAAAHPAGEAGDVDGHDQDRTGGHDNGHAPERIHLTEAQFARLDIEVAAAEAGRASAYVEAPATVAFDDDRVARVGPRLSAKVVEVVADLGDRVEPGDPVAIMDSVALGKAKARHLTTRAHLQTVRADYQRQRTLAEKQIASEAVLMDAEANLAEAEAEHDAADEELRLYGLSADEIDDVEADSDQPLSRYVLTSPIAGVVQRRDLVPGETVGPGDTPIHIVDTRRMWLSIEASEQAIPELATGLPVILTVRPLPGREFTGRTDWVSRELDAQARTLRVRAMVDNPDGLLRAGMFGTARIRTGSEGDYALVPVDAVQSLEGREVVFVPGDEPGAFRAVGVVTGREAGGRIEIRSGLEPGADVVTAGAFDLTSALTAADRSATHSH